MNIPAVDGLVLSDGKVLLRPYQRDDIERLYEAAIESVETVYPWLLWCHPKYSMAESEQWVKSRPAEWAAGNSFEFVMVDPKNSRFVGACGLNQFRMEHKIANLGYWVRRTAMGRGYAPAATRLLARFGFEQLGLNRIEIVAAAGNIPSQRAAEKAGPIREGVLRARLTIQDKVHDAVIYSFIPADFGIAA